MSHGDQSPRRSPQITPSAGADELTRLFLLLLLLHLLLLMLTLSLHSSFKNTTLRLHVHGKKRSPDVAALMVSLGGEVGVPSIPELGLAGVCWSRPQLS